LGAVRAEHRAIARGTCRGNIQRTKRRFNQNKLTKK